jgi:OOP family OmpA-OmpF porin
MVGGSLTPTGGLSTLQDEQLREFWREFFAYCGGRLVVWDSTLIAFPASGQGPAASWTAQHQMIIPLPASVLFQANRAVLLPGAGQILDELARKLTVTYPRATAAVAGFTAAVSGPGPSALALSRARAQAVVAYLEARGVSASRLLVRGYGDQHQIPGGSARNRRVVVTLHVP